LGDKDVILAVVRLDGLMLKYASSRMIEDKDVVVTAILQNSLAFEFAGPFLRNNKNMVILATQGNSKALDYALISPRTKLVVVMHIVLSRLCCI
jgi:hypothetical protein